MNILSITSRRVPVLPVLAVFIALAALLPAQELSEKRDISIFRVNYYGAPPAPVSDTIRIRTEIGNTTVDIRLQGSGSTRTDQIFQETIAGVDAEIRQVFQNLGRFNVIAYPQRVDYGNLSAFIDAIREYREADVEIPEAVRLGQEAFTEQDLNRIINSFIMVVPTVTYYQLVQDDSSNWEAEIITSFSIINIEDYRTIAEFSVETSGYDEDPQSAMRSAVSGIPGQLNFAVRSIDEFKIRTAIIERIGSRIVLAFGNVMGIMVGDEFEVTRLEEFAGYTVPRRIALLRIREVSREYSIAQVIYEREMAVVGDQVKEVPRVGVDGTFFVTGMVDLTASRMKSVNIGLKAAPNRGFYAFRPLIGMEVQIPSAREYYGPTVGLPVGIRFGAEYNLFLNRFRLIPQAYFGLLGVIPLREDSDFSLNALSTTAMLGLAYMLPAGDDHLEVYIEAGYELQFGLSTDNNYQGILAGAGIRFR
jgi:hypothetical protein